MFWVNSSTGIYDPKKGIFRKARSKYQMNGVADILGIYCCIPLAIEVKSVKGVMSSEQRLFLNNFSAFGGIAILARSVDDVEKALKLVKTGKREFF